MKAVWVILKKELRYQFLSPLAYVLAAFFMLILGYVFYQLITSYAQFNGRAPILDAVWRPFFGWVNILICLMTPLVTMSSFTAEENQKTLDLLMGAPIYPWHIVISKFLGALSVLSFMLGLTMLYPMILGLAGMNEWGAVVSSYFGIFFTLGCYTAIGIFSSSISRHQIVSALMALIIIFFFLMISWAGQTTPNFLMAQILKYSSLFFHLDHLTMGLFRSYSLVYYCSLWGFFLYGTTLSLRSRYW